MFGFTWVNGLVLLVAVVAVCWLIGRLIRFFARPTARHDEPQGQDTIRDSRGNGPRT